MKHYQKPLQKEETFNPWETPKIQDGAKVGIYARQSTLFQVKNNSVSTEMQTDDLIALAKQLGVEEQNIILYVENRREDGTIKNASGRLRIDQREGLHALVQRIETGEIKAVITYLEDRLFRDETQIQVNTFILICQEHHVLVITPFMTYDFHNPYHVKQFRWKCEQAADFLREYVKQRLHAAQARTSSQGKYAGGSLPVGYIVDRRECIDGLKNPLYKKFIPYQPHAEVFAYIFTRYLELGGIAKKLFRELLHIPVLFPDFEPTVDARNVSRLLLKKVSGGYHISYNGLLYLLTNIVYIGWWSHDDGIIVQNHEAIVPEEVFWYAFYRNSDYTPHGEEHKRENHSMRRYNKTNKPEAPALLKEIIRTNEPKKAVYVGYRFSDWYYMITWTNNAVEPVLEKFSILVDHVDEAVKTALFTHMENTRDFEHFRSLAKQTKNDQEKEEADRRKNLARVERRMKATLLSLTTDEALPTVTRTALNQIYAQLVEERETLLTQPSIQTPEKKVSLLLSYHNLLEKLQREDSEHVDNIKLLIQATISTVTIDALSPHFVLLTIVWRTPIWGTDTALLWRPRGRTPYWKEEELAVMRTHYATARQEELLPLLPIRSWHSINQQATTMGIKRTFITPIDTRMFNLCVRDTEIMQEYGLTMEELSSDNQIIWVVLPVHLVGLYL